MLNFISAILAVHDKNELDTDKVTDSMVNLSKANLIIYSIFIVLLSFAIAINPETCRSWMCVFGSFIVFVVLLSLLFVVDIAYSACMISDYDTDKTLTERTLVFSKVYIGLFVIYLVFSGIGKVYK